jgi:hypothetical protein
VHCASLTTVLPGFAPDTLWASRCAGPACAVVIGRFEERIVWTFPLFS